MLVFSDGYTTTSIVDDLYQIIQKFSLLMKKLLATILSNIFTQLL